MDFDLQPGQGAVARFAITPGSSGDWPVLTASGIDVGTSRDTFLVTQEKTYSVMPSPSPVRIDGRVTDKDYWKTLPALLGFSGPGGETVSRPVEGRVTVDRAGLVIALSMGANLVSTANPSANDPDQDRDGAVLQDESVEIWLDPAHRGREYYHFAANTRNVPYDESSRDGPAFNPQWQHAVRFGRVGGQETWNFEARLPWAALDLAGPPEKGAVWGLQIVRRDYSSVREAGRRRGSGATAEVSQWTPTFGPNTRPGLYGSLVFGDLSSLASPEEPESRTGPATPFFRGSTTPPPAGGIFGATPPSVTEPPAPDL
jgi:hypothetical protein